jgi:polysaccharide export outer membrane protein
VSLVQSGSSRFYVLGQVTKAGVFPLTTRTTLVQALAQAGGFKEFAKVDRIVIVREDGGEPTFIPVNYKKLESGTDLQQNVVLRPGDTILVP